MKLPFSMILDQLQRFSIKYSHVADDEAMYCRPVFWSPDAKMENGFYCVPESGLIPESIEPSTALLGAKSNIPSYENMACSVIILESEKDLFPALNLINTLFDQIELWDNTFQKMLRNPENQSLRKRFLTLLEMYLENGITIVDSNYQVFSQSEKDSDHQAYLQQYNQEGVQIVPSETVESFKYTEKFRDTYYNRDIFLYEDDYFPFRGLCKNIFYRNRLCYRIVISEHTRSFKKSDTILLEMLASKMELFAAQYSAVSPGKMFYLLQSLNALMKDGKVEGKELQNSYTKSSWTENDRLRIVVMMPSLQDEQISSLKYICQEFMDAFEETAAVPFGRHLVLLMNESQGHIQDKHGKFSEMIREKNLRAGRSNSFTRRDDLFLYYKQARTALELGSQIKPMVWIHDFSHYVLPYLLQKAAEDYSPQELYSPIYLTLAEYDHIHGTEYVKTLQTYLEDNRNATQTARDLFIHRGTLLFRIDRICEIAHTELKDQDELLHVMLTFRMISSLFVKK